ncbi:MAG TPA: 50S ribosomal protein L9 [Nitrospinota bacterium]|nr:50S ribosomal protein L9 [Nitrospinota bacterium]
MKLILKENIKDLGNAGDVIQVSDGYARNYLIPKGLAKLATPQNIKLLDQESKERKNKLMKEKKEAELFAKRLEEISCTIVKKSGEKDKLFGSVTPQDIQEGLRNEGIEIDKKKIVLEEPIKTLGVYKASIQVHPEVNASLKVWVVKE